MHSTPTRAAVRAVSAKTLLPNTPESDRKPIVPHRVTLSDGSTVEVMAADPLAAIAEYNRPD